MVVDELLEYVSSYEWVWVGYGNRQVFYGWAKHVPESVRDLMVAVVRGDEDIPGVLDIYVKEEI